MNIKYISNETHSQSAEGMGENTPMGSDVDNLVRAETGMDKKFFRT